MTDLPIDYRKRPWKQKYIDEETPELNRWMIFGEYPDGSVGISDGQIDIFTHVPRDKALLIVTARNAFVAIVVRELGSSQ